MDFKAPGFHEGNLAAQKDEGIGDGRDVDEFFGSHDNLLRGGRCWGRGVDGGGGCTAAQEKGDAERDGDDSVLGRCRAFFARFEQRDGAYLVHIGIEIGPGGPGAEEIACVEKAIDDVVEKIGGDVHADSKRPPTQDGVRFIAAAHEQLPDQCEQGEREQAVADGAPEGRNPKEFDGFVDDVGREAADENGEEFVAQVEGTIVGQRFSGGGQETD